ncbi:YwqG family protein [Bacillus sp. FSL K6-3431]|uniref:YwqG family protein n=1 Tax=Bacillus sp. FSL K6-3431 TaxID=2921500 RepID=UPI0030F79C11
MIRSTIMLSKKLESYRYEIEKTVKPFLKIETINEKPRIYHSKFAGHPYLPKTAEHPLDENGKQMKLLAQLNFAKIPHLEHMPQKGLLQFFIAADDDLLGLDFDDQTKQNNFRVVYFPEVITDESLLVSDFSYIQEVEESYFPIEKELSLSFTVGEEPVATGDHRFDHSYSNLDFDEVIDRGGEKNETLWDLFAEELSNEGHKIGG